MYVVKYKQRVVLGIIPWNSQYISDVMRSRYRVTVDVPFNEPDASQFPLVINSDITIYAAEEDRPPTINPMVEFYYGPTWDLVGNKMVARYQVLPLELENAKGNYRTKAAQLRYAKEIAGTKVEFNGTEYSIETTRGQRSKYVEKFVTMTDTQTVNWKFSEGWVTLTKAQLLTVVNAIDEHVQGAFDYELGLVFTINAATSNEQLLAIEELNKPQMQPGM